MLRSAGRNKCDRWMSSDLRWPDHEPEEPTPGSSDALYRPQCETAGIERDNTVFKRV